MTSCVAFWPPSREYWPSTSATISTFEASETVSLNDLNSCWSNGEAFRPYMNTTLQGSTPSQASTARLPRFSPCVENGRRTETDTPSVWISVVVLSGPSGRSVAPILMPASLACLTSGLSAVPFSGRITMPSYCPAAIRSWNCANCLSASNCESITVISTFSLAPRSLIACVEACV